MSYFRRLSPSFPNASIGSATGLWTDPSFGGNPGETGTGPPIKTFGGDAFEIILIANVLIPRQLAAE